MPPAPPPLPIDDALPALRAALRARRCAVLQAPPGAGKTTRVPLALLDEPWLAGRRIVMLEPRRLAARAAARRMAATLGEPVGATVGHRVRHDTRVGPRTRIEVVTEGVLARLLQDDPALEAYGAVLFDEYHERSLHADLGLALTLQTQELLRDDLRVLAMSATLDGARVAALLGGAEGSAPVVTSAGRSFPVAVHWRDRRPEPRALESAVASTVRAALDRHAGDVLVFLPGAAEIRRVGGLLADGPLPAGTRVHALHGTLPQHEQDAALDPSPPGTRKVVLSTAIAETSLTIEGVRVVVDAGLARVPRFDPRTAMTHLDTVRASRASAEQRAGRAGRVAPGDCYRLWAEAEHAGLVPHASPEVLDADGAPLALELAAAFLADPAALPWLDVPPGAAFAEARAQLAQLGALDAAGRVTAHGTAMAALPMHPRLAHMALRARALGLAALACDLAAPLGARDLLRADGPVPPDADVRLRLDLLARGDVPATALGWAVDREGVRRARQEARALRDALDVRAPATADDQASAGRLLSLAYPDRVARRRDPSLPSGQASGEGRYLLRNGRGAALPDGQALAREPWLVAAELGGTVTQERRILLAAPVTLAELLEEHADQLARSDEVAWDDAADAVRARRTTRAGALVLEAGPAREADPEAVAHALRDLVRVLGVGALQWDDEARRVRERLAFARRWDGDAWPDVSDDALHAALDEWLLPVLVGRRRWVDVQRLDLGALLLDRLPWARRAALDEVAPTHLPVPTGSRIRLDYADVEAPVLAVRLQELFGLQETPRVARGRVAVVLHLLSPAHRPVQVTRDLAGFWRSSYYDVRRDLRGRYPRHHWPEDPLQAEPTRRAKPKGT
ncbi:ATP-dependent helicase HrpB [Roseisolibacter sp. H3M3-2]|uniref:ATP-dependent helicase HrpB n=1 Tax=Roseisolibacter sp. H3M3-2 TaxID=3031323 RepID=UPI0023DA3711|nr:ATP-dependent helicase HrpB [Roseisolibacter sp. H3M3-2]MDF1502899.1 ATP-dependent helicase HrpB [Roseisolibacter sp. H3M3-2]